jgi:small GTP-binding protein
MEESIFLKIIVVGETGVGKTSILSQYCFGRFETDVVATIGCDFSMKVLRASDGRPVRLQLWDIAGQEKYKSMAKVYIRNSSGCIIVADANKESSLTEAVKWKEFIDQQTMNTDGVIIPALIIQNKADTIPAEAAEFQTQDYLETFALSNKFVRGFQVSAKTDLNLSTAIEFLAHHIVNQSKKFTTSSTNVYQSIKLSGASVLQPPKSSEKKNHRSKNCC